MGAIVLGIDLGGTRIKTAVVSGDKEILARDVRSTPADEGVDAVVDAMVESAQAALAEAGVEAADAAGIGAPGPMNWRTGIVYSPPNLKGWTNVPLADLMGKRLGIPCFVDNDANLACYGEYHKGAGRDVESMCLLTLGTGVGGGIIVFGKLLRGIDGTAGEIGHMTVERDGRQCGCGSRGCLEQYASVTGMVKTAREGLEAGRESALRVACGGDVGRITGKMISDAAEQGDEFARWVVQETGEWLGVGISSLINLLNPEAIVLGGGMISAGDLLFEATRRRARADAFEVPAKRAQIIPAELGDDAGVIGAAAMALDGLHERA